MREIDSRKETVGVPARRQEVIEMLNEAYARDFIEMEEFEDRIVAVHAARYLEELEKLVADLPVQIISPHRRKDPEATQGCYSTRVVLGQKNLQGNWLNKRGARLETVLGSMTVDCRKLQLKEGVTTFNLSVVLGELTIIIPPGLTVETDVHQVLSSSEYDPLLNRVKKVSEAVLHLKGNIVLSSLNIMVK